MKDWLITILENNPINATALFIIGVLMVIIIQNFFFYFNHKDKAYLWYSFYAFIICFDQISLLQGFYILKTHGVKPYYYGIIHHAMEWLYNSAYVIFVIEFGGLLLLRKSTALKVKKALYGLVIFLIVLVIIDFINKSHWVRINFLIVLVPSLIIISIIVYKHLFQMKTIVKYYIIPGSLAFTIFSISALIVGLSNPEENRQLSWLIFYIGVFTENIFFSLGLVVKQKLVLTERNKSQNDLIIQLRENENLKNTLTKNLQEEVNKQTKEIIALNEKAKIEKIKQLKVAFDKQLVDLKISSLQSQMNPHFIFNSLNSIKLYIIKNDKENAVYFLNKFSKLIRKILAASRAKEVSLKEEIETLELYANIENIRFKNEIKISFNIDNKINLSTIKIPPLILQPFIENAIWHGLSPKDGLKKLNVDIIQNDASYVIINIIDNGIGRKKSFKIKANKLHKKNSIGIKLTKERLTNFSQNFKNNFSLLFTDLEDDGKPIGTKVTLKLPLI